MYLSTFCLNFLISTIGMLTIPTSQDSWEEKVSEFRLEQFLAHGEGPMNACCVVLPFVVYCMTLTLYFILGRIIT